MNNYLSTNSLAHKVQSVTLNMADGSTKDLTVSDSMLNKLIAMIDDPNNKEAKSPYLLLEVIKLKEQMSVTKAKLVMDLLVAMKIKSSLPATQDSNPLTDLSGISIEDRESIRESV